MATQTEAMNELKAQNTILAGCVGVLILPVLTVILSIPEALVIIQLWSWFVVPTFNAPPLTFATAFGVSLIVGMMTKQIMPKTNEDDLHYLGRWALSTITTPVVALISAWIVYQFA